MNETPISAKVIADSIGNHGMRLTTMLVTYPRFIHAEHLRHRMFSFNVGSSRAIPMKKFRQIVEEAPAMPVWWGKNEPGMQAKAELSGEKLEEVMAIWDEARNDMLDTHRHLENLGLHKQIANRILEAWLPVTVLVSGTDWINFFKLRCHSDAQPEAQALGDVSLAAYVASRPQPIEDGAWHLPFCDQFIDFNWSISILKKVSVARCARLSYLNFADGNNVDVNKDIALHDRLAASRHWSPFEQVARCLETPVRSGNFKGWEQYRKTFHEENWEDDYQVDLDELLLQRRAAGSKFVG